MFSLTQASSERHSLGAHAGRAALVAIAVLTLALLAAGAFTLGRSQASSTADAERAERSAERSTFQRSKDDAYKSSYDRAHGDSAETSAAEGAKAGAAQGAKAGAVAGRKAGLRRVARES